MTRRSMVMQSVRLWSLCLLVGAALIAQEPDVFVLPRPRPARPERDDQVRADLAKRLCEAIDRGDEAACRQALADGANPDEGMGAGKDSTKGRTPLIHAVVARNTALVDVLVAAGARLDNGDDARHTPLMYAALTGNAEMLSHLLRLGARPDVTDAEDRLAVAYVDENGEVGKLLTTAAAQHTALLTAVVDGDMVAARQALAAGASPNANDGKVSLLGYVVRHNEPELLPELLRAGCRPDLFVVDGFAVTTPLAIAAEAAELAVLQALLAHGKSSQPALDLALAIAAGAGKDDGNARVQALLAAGADAAAPALLQTPALPAAAARGDLPMLKLLLEAGADQGAVDHALIHAAGHGDGERALATVRALLAVGANPSFEFLYATALGAAAGRGHGPVMELLLGKVDDATLNIAVAEVARNQQVDGLRWLCEHGGARIDFAFQPGVFKSALGAAVENDDLASVEVLLAAGAKADQEASLLQDPPLLAAVRERRLPIVKALLAAGADPERVWSAPLRGEDSALSVARALGDAALLELLIASARHVPQDPVGALLFRTALGWKDVGEFYDLTFTDPDTGRSHRVHVRKAVDEWEGLKAQELFGLGYDAKDPPGDELLATVFAKRFNIGGLVLEEPSAQQPNWRVRYRLHAHAGMSAAALTEYLESVFATADELERLMNPGAEDRL